MEDSKKCHSEKNKLSSILNMGQKRKPKYVNKCKTKNSLALFKTAHLKFLQREGVQLLDWPRVMNFYQKEGASKEDFVELYQERGLARVL